MDSTTGAVSHRTDVHLPGADRQIRPDRGDICHEIDEFHHKNRRPCLRIGLLHDVLGRLSIRHRIHWKFWYPDDAGRAGARIAGCGTPGELPAADSLCCPAHGNGSADVQTMVEQVRS